MGGGEESEKLVGKCGTCLYGKIHIFLAVINAIILPQIRSAVSVNQLKFVSISILMSKNLSLKVGKFCSV